VSFLTKATSVKFPKEMLAEIDNECEGLGCNRTDFIRDAVQKKLEGKSQDQEENTPRPDRNPTPKPEPEPEPKEEPKPTLTKIPEKKPQVVFVDGDPRDYEIIKSEPKPRVEANNVRVVTEPLDNSNKPRIDHVLFNGKYIPKAEVYER